MSKYIIKVNRKKLYVKYLMDWTINSTIVPIMTDNIDNSLVFDNKKEVDTLLTKLSKNFNNLTILEV